MIKETLSNEVSERISREKGNLIGNMNFQIQRAVEVAICNQLLPLVQGVPSEVRNRDVSGLRDRKRPAPKSECLVTVRSAAMK